MKNHAVPSLGLRIMQGGIADQHPLRNRRDGGIRDRGQADTCRGADLPCLDRKGVSFNALSQPLRKNSSLLPVRMGEHDREGVASVSSDDIALAHRRPYQIGRRLEHVISGHVAKTVVDGLEEIQVQQQETSRRAIAKPDAQLPCQGAVECPWVEHLREWVAKSRIPYSQTQLGMAQGERQRGTNRLNRLSFCLGQSIGIFRLNEKKSCLFRSKRKRHFISKVSILFLQRLL